MIYYENEIMRLKYFKEIINVNNMKKVSKIYNDIFRYKLFLFYVDK